MPAILAISWWLAVQIVAWRNYWEDFQELAALHEKETLSWRVVAESPIPDHYVDDWHEVVQRDRRCSYFVGRDRPLTEAEKMEETCVRERAGHRAAYHRGLQQKYAWMAWFPWIPLATDPPQPE